MLLGVAGIVLGVLGGPAPVLSCLLLVGLGADSDLARRASLFDQAGFGRWAGLIRSMHASLYAWLYVVAWLSMADASSLGDGRNLLLVDLALSAAVLLGFLAFARRD